MQFCPGDIILVNDIVFDDIREDHAQQGRPCIVLYTKKTNRTRQEIYFLPLTSKLQNKKYKHYYKLNLLSTPSLVDLSTIYKTDKKSITKIIANANDHLTKIINATIKINKKNQTPLTEKTVAILNCVKENVDLYDESLEQRNEQLQKKQNIPIPYEKTENVGKILAKKHKYVYQCKLEASKNVAF